MEQEHVARDDLARWELCFLPVPEHRRRGRGHAPQRLQGVLGTVLLHESKEHGEKHDDADRERLDAVAEER